MFRTYRREASVPKILRYKASVEALLSRAEAQTRA